MLFTPLVQGVLKTRFVGQRMTYHSELASTNLEAQAQIKKGAKQGTCIITDHQIEGKGRHGRIWKTHRDKSLTFSVILYPNSEPIQTGWYPLLSGLAVAEALGTFKFPVQLKWPNDIRVQQKKLGGILCESIIREKKIKSMIMGIGLNINETKSEFESDLQRTATSMFLAANRFFQREQILAEILNALEKWLFSFESEGPDTIISHWLDYCEHRDQSVQFHSGDDIIKGVFLGLGPHGEAKLKVDGKEKLYSAGEVN